MDYNLLRYYRDSLETSESLSLAPAPGFAKTRPVILMHNPGGTPPLAGRAKHSRRISINGQMPRGTARFSVCGGQDGGGRDSVFRALLRPDYLITIISNSGALSLQVYTRP